MKTDPLLQQNERAFSPSQIRNIWIGSIGIAIFSFLLFFPLTNMVLYIVQKNYPETEISNRTISINFLGNLKSAGTNIYDRNFLASINELNFGVNVWGLFWGDLNTTGTLRRAHLDTRFVSLEMDSAIWDIAFSNLWSANADAPGYTNEAVLSYRTGLATFEANQVKLLQVGKGLNTYIDSELLEVLNIDQIRIRLEAQNDNYAIRSSQISSNLILLTFDGYIDKLLTFQNASVCLEAQSALESQYPQLYGLFALQNSLDKPLCYRIQGTVEAPQFAIVQ